ncbi:MAG: hypothetical protein ACRDD2_00785 [Sarcina sp.]
MSVYLINYYLKEHAHSEDCGCEGEEHHHHHRDTYELQGEIKELGAWAHIMPTSFIVKTEKTSEEILEKIKFTVEDTDMILVTKIDETNVATLNPQITAWIKSN